MPTRFAPFLFALLLCACEESPLTAPPAAAPVAVPPPVGAAEVRIIGVLRRSGTRMPIVGGQLFAPERKRFASADVTGSFELVIPVETGAGAISINVRARAIGFKPESHSLRVVPGQVVTLDIELQPDVIICFTEVTVGPAPARVARPRGLPPR